MPSHRGRGRIKKKKKKVAVLRDTVAGKDNSLALSRGNATSSDVTKCTAAAHPRRTSANRGDETILCIKQKAPQYDIPRVSYLRFVHISSASRARRYTRDTVSGFTRLHFMRCVQCTARYFYSHVFAYISYTGGCTDRALL